ncbi:MULTISPECIES: MFS transporter [Brevibacillus]|uniref:MFS transporter n=1 Tax=Brevibacillus brevis TaxID=1393 RepID=A0A2Z4MN61_BREBE|nr:MULTISPECIES: MFS transporter [Brevibacillus]AWX57956.1 MFS transporter [Brevibacillus brevis]NRR21305.1 MFS transporter [Brevibacillus sp. MS2.2]
MVSARTRNWILALLFLGWALGNLDRYVMNYAILSITEDLQLSASSTGLLLSSFFAGYALMQMPGGWLADRFGARKVLIASVVMWSIFTGLTGAAWSMASMILIRFLFGIGEGGFQPASSKIIATIFPVKERSRAMSVMLSSSAIVGLFSPILSVWMIQTMGWRTMFVAIGAIGAIIAFLFWRYIKLPQTETAMNTTGSDQPKSSVAMLFKTPLLWSLLIAYFSIYAVNWGLVTWMPTYLSKVRGLDMISLGWLQTIPGFATLVGIYVSGYVLDKLPKGREKIIGSFSCVVVAVLLYFMFTASSVTMFITYQAIVSLFLSFVIILLPSVVLKNLPAAVAGTGMGIVNTGGQLAGFITPMAIGFIVEAFNGSFDAAFWMLIGFAVICIGALLSLNYEKGELLKQNADSASA